MQDKIWELKQEKADLENTIQELSDQIDISRSSLGENNLLDELAQLSERSSRNSTPRRFSTFDFKRVEKYAQEISEKNY